MKKQRQTVIKKQCKYYGHDIKCVAEVKGEKCEMAHCPILKEAYQTHAERTRNYDVMTKRELRLILEKDNKNDW